MSASLGGSALTKAGIEARFGAIEVDALQEDAMEMEVQLMALPKRWINVTDPGWTWSRGTRCDHLVHIILPNRGTDDRMDLRGEVL